MNESHPSEDRAYSLFPAVWIALLALVAVFGMQTYNLIQQKNNLNSSARKLSVDYMRALKIDQTMLALGSDLDQLSKDSPAARQIMEECKIQISNRSSSPGATPLPMATGSTPPSAHSLLADKKK